MNVLQNLLNQISTNIRKSSFACVFNSLKSQLQITTKKRLLLCIVILVVGSMSLYICSTQMFHNKESIVYGKTQTDVETLAAEERIVYTVYVSGEVKNPGVYSLSENARYINAIEAAGGATEEANLDAINLATEITDGIQIYVPNKNSSSSSNNNLSSANTSSSKSTSSGLVNINTADASELESLPGVGASTASKIIADRNANGKFESIEDLTRVSGIGEKKLAAIREYICV